LRRELAEGDCIHTVEQGPSHPVHDARHLSANRFLIDARDQVTVRVDEAEASTRVQILNGHGAKQSGFARARLADDVGMEKSVFELDAKASAIAPEVYVAKKCDVVSYVHSRQHSLGGRYTHDVGLPRAACFSASGGNRDREPTQGGTH